MELKDQVCSLESARKLKELGVKQESLFYWHETARLDGINNINQSKINSKYCYSAFTVAELGEMLPFRLRRTDDDYWLWQTKLKHGGTEIRYSDAFHQKIPFNQIQDETEAESRAKMLIYLLENKLI